MSWYRMERGWMDNPFFKPEPFTEREAWEWMIAAAAWEPTRVRMGDYMVDLARGQLAYSSRFLADRWQWSEARVRRFQNRLKIDAMIDADADAGVTRLTIRNYCKYQDARRTSDAPADAPCDAGPTQDRRKEEELKESKNKKKKDAAASRRYRYEGSVVRLTDADFTKFRQTYKNIPDLEAALMTVDAYLADEPVPDKKWFFRTTRWLEKTNAEHTPAAEGYGVTWF